MEDKQIGLMFRQLQFYAAMVYFVPETEQELTSAGLEPGLMCYLAGRTAPMGAASASVVRAVTYNFNPRVVAVHIPRAWALAAPEKLTAATLVGVDRALHRALGAEALTAPEVAEAADLVRRAAEAAAVEGRPLAAAHQELEWPAAPHLVLWHGVNTLREHRGDGHIALLVDAGLSGLQAMVSNAATKRGFLPSFAQAHRGWSAHQWAGAEAELCDRGILDHEGEFTDAGAALRSDLEDNTDRLAAAPWRVIGDDGVRRVGEIGGRLVRGLTAAGCFPTEGVFYPPKS